jgi:hypothetical protein
MRTMMEMIRILKSIVCTLAWPIQPLAIHAALGAVVGLGVEPLAKAMAPDIVLLRLFIKSERGFICQFFYDAFLSYRETERGRLPDTRRLMMKACRG